MKDEFRAVDSSDNNKHFEEELPFSLIIATFLITIPSFVHGVKCLSIDLILFVKCPCLLFIVVRIRGRRSERLSCYRYLWWKYCIHCLSLIIPYAYAMRACRENTFNLLCFGR